MWSNIRLSIYGVTALAGLIWPFYFIAKFVGQVQSGSVGSSIIEIANTFIDGVPKGDMVSPQVQELYMLVEYLAESTEKLKEQMEAEVPLILKNEMIIQFHEDRIIDLEERKNGSH